MSAGADSPSGQGSHLLRPPTNPADRVFITLMPPPHDTDFGDHKVVKTLAQLCLNGWPTSALTWAETPDRHKELVWQEFQRYYTWDPEATHAIYRIFCEKAKTRTKDNLKNARSRAERFASADDSDVRSHNPHWCNQLVWAGMCDKWQAAEWQKRQAVARKNRSSGMAEGSNRAPATWKGGSISQLQHFNQESHTAGASVDWLDVYVNTRQNIPVAHSIDENYKELMDAKYTEGMERPAIDLELWERASVVKKNFVKGLGQRRKYHSGGSSSSSSYSSQSSQTSPHPAPHTTTDCLRAVFQDKSVLADFSVLLGTLSAEDLALAQARFEAQTAAETAAAAAETADDDATESD